MTATTGAETATTPSGSGNHILTLPFDMARRILPESSTPVLLGGGALALAGLIDWPVAGAAWLGYLALRRWHPAS